METSEKASVEWVDVAAEQAGQRIDNFLLSRLKGVPRSKIYSILRSGEVRVNKGRTKPDYRLQPGDRIRIPPLRRSAERTPSATPQALRQLDDRILYEDKRILILNKPARLAVHGGSGISAGVIEILRQARPDEAYLELVHRLDRETSGCLLIAKRRSALRQLHTLLREGQVDKRYVALVRGRWQGGRREISAPLHKNVLRSGERIVRVSEQGKASQSVFSPLAVTDQASLMEIALHTGRTHQIRVHAAHVNHPVAGDEKYGDAQFNRQLRQLGLRRLFLHARSLAFTLSEPHTSISVNAPLEADLIAVLNQLKIEY
jgi:23S rRNA pseudouridine955/2504/2580 synthase